MRSYCTECGTSFTGEVCPVNASHFTMPILEPSQESASFIPAKKAEEGRIYSLYQSNDYSSLYLIVKKDIVDDEVLSIIARRLQDASWQTVSISPYTQFDKDPVTDEIVEQRKKAWMPAQKPVRGVGEEEQDVEPTKAKRGARTEIYRMLDEGATEEMIRSAFPAIQPATLRTYLYVYNRTHNRLEGASGREFGKPQPGMRTEIYRMLDEGATEEAIRSAFPKAHPGTIKSYIYAYNRAHGITSAKVKRGARTEIYRMLDEGATEETIRSAFPTIQPATLRSYLYAYKHSHNNKLN